MYEITRCDNALFESFKNRSKTIAAGTYDFTFENRFLIYHAPVRHQIVYLALDRTTGFGSEVCSSPEKIYGEQEFISLIPKILWAIKYTGDQRCRVGIHTEPDELIDQIFRLYLPQFGFRVREEQIKLAHMIYEGLQRKKASICEAEVGTGKTMAYLVAAFCEKRRRELRGTVKAPLTIVTSSIELQTSIMQKEIPLLSHVLKEMGIVQHPLKAVLRKGKDHYLCPVRYEAFIKMLLKSRSKNQKMVEMLRQARLAANKLDLDRIRLSGVVKQSICVRGGCGACPQKGCCRYAAFVANAMQDVALDIQVVNHNLYLMSGKIPGLLRPGTVVVIDEAHKLKDAAQDVYGQQIGEGEVQRCLNQVSLLYQKQKNKEKILRMYSDIKKNNKAVFAQLRKIGHLNGATAEESSSLLSLPLAVFHMIVRLKESLDRLNDQILMDVGRKESRIMTLCDNLSSFFMTSALNIWVTTEETGETCLCSCPKELGSEMNKYLWSGPASFALLSGTMSDGKNFQFFKRENGLDLLPETKIQEVSIQSPFDFQNHTRLYIPCDLPMPAYEDKKYFRAIADRVMELVQATNGHTAILFTSYQMLHKIHELTKDRLDRYEVICMGRNNKTAIADFKKSKNGVLFASGSMWEGVDCAGDVLSSVIIVRLPFPLRTATMEQKKSNCSTIREFIDEYAVPEMLIKLRQGAGRLIRSETDTGVLSILDARAAAGRPYRLQVEQALGKYPMVTSVAEVAAFIDQVKDDTYKNA